MSALHNCVTNHGRFRFARFLNQIIKLCFRFIVQKEVLLLGKLCGSRRTPAPLLRFSIFFVRLLRHGIYSTVQRMYRQRKMGELNLVERFGFVVIFNRRPPFAFWGRLTD